MAQVSGLADTIRTKVRDLPPLPDVVTKLVAVVADERSSAADVTKVLSGDLALSAKILKLVNSSFYGQSGEIATISRAVVVLGFAAVRNLAMGLAAGSALKRAGGAEYQQRFWSHALATAAAAEVLARHGGLPPDPEEAFVAGLLHDVGHPVMALAAPGPFAEMFAGGPDGLLAREETVYGMSHAKAGQMLLRRWKLPKDLCDVVRFHHNAQVAGGGEMPLVSLVCMADMLACVVDDVYERTEPEPDLAALARTVNLDPGALGTILTETAARIDEGRAFLQIATDGAIAPQAAAPPPPRRVALLGTDPVRARWIHAILEHYSCTAVGMKEFFAAGLDGPAPADVVIVDCASIKPAQLAQMAPVLARTPAAVRALGDPAGAVAAALGRPVPALPLVFSRQELD